MSQVSRSPDPPPSSQPGSSLISSTPAWYTPTAPSPLGQHRFPTSTPASVPTFTAGFHVSQGGSAGHDDTYLDSDPDPDPERDYNQDDDFDGSDTGSGVHEEEDQDQEQWPQFHQHDQSIDPCLSSQQIQASS